MKRQNLDKIERANAAAMKLYSPHRDEREGILRVELPDRPTPAQWQAWAWDIERLIEAGYDTAAILRDNGDRLEAFAEVDPLRHAEIVRAIGGGNG